jgi:hypothetical protein
MYKIIELEIDPEVSGNTGVFEVAWVEYPAIEQELMYFSQQKFFKAPDYVSSKACQAIKENEKRGNPAGTQVGKVRAQQLCNQEEISLETVKRMKSFLSRAATYDTGNWDDNGTIAMGLWGGKEALTWVNKILDQQEEMGIQDFVENAGGFSTGDYVSWTYAGRGEGDDRARGQITDLRVSGEVNVPDTDFTLNATEDNPVALIKTVDGTIVGQYVKNLRKIQKPEGFVYPSIGESKDEFISRCIAYVVNEGKTEDEAAGQCYGMWENREFAPDKVSFDWDDTLDTRGGKMLLEQELSRGSLIYIISARSMTSKEMIDLANEYGFPASHIYTTGSNQEKVEKIKELGIKRHYDNNFRVIQDLDGVGIKFDYDVTGLPSYDNYPSSGDTDSMLVEPELFNCGCGESKEVKMEMDNLNVLGYETKYFYMCPGAIALFTHLTQMELTEDATGMIRSAAQIADNVFGIEENVISNGFATPEEYNQAKILVDDFKDVMEEIDEIVGMKHDVSFMDGHIKIIEDYLNEPNDWDEEDLKMKSQFDRLRFSMSRQEFEAVTNPLLRGFTESEIYALNHPTPTNYFLYKRVLSGSPDRDFCMSIEGRYFRRAQIDALRDVNTQFGHNRQPYSKWLYKGGPQCVHAWEKYMFQERNKVNLGRESLGVAGKAPQEMMGKGYYPGTSRYKANLSQQVSYTKSLDCFGDLCKVGFSKQTNQMFATKTDQRMVYTPLMIPNILIPRFDEVSNEKYYVKFTPETILKIQQKFMIEQRTRATNYEHSDKKYNDAVMVESWIVEGEKDKSYELGFTQEQIPFGTWMGGYKILETPEGNEIWNELIKKGKVKGMSVEGNFLMNFSQVKTDEYLLEQIINILNQITD